MPAIIHTMHALGVFFHALALMVTELAAFEFEHQCKISQSIIKE